jgi:hypothetical protein
MLPGNKSVSDLLRLPPTSMLAWVQQHSAAIDCSQDWQDLAYGSSSRLDVDARLSDEDFEALASAAVLIYDRLGETCTKASERSSSISDSMALRAVVISKFGPQSGHPVRDPGTLEDWFFRRLNVPFEKAVSMARDSLKLSTADFLWISSLKDRVRLMKSVQPQQVFSRKDELNRWYELLETSPGQSQKP